eukprot:TRINITY_DN30129_c0_g1_i4.p1 TRINITY_DN30129_c0_g1~~TRINITY_DN30129_c0_g1_i4.p1  ORF type:complete len:286 (+),score=18.63 TRINITY_DN30129_c0_g1_i4:154-1011(+)
MPKGKNLIAVYDTRLPDQASGTDDVLTARFGKVVDSHTQADISLGHFTQTFQGPIELASSLPAVFARHLAEHARRIEDKYSDFAQCCGLGDYTALRVDDPVDASHFEEYLEAWKTADFARRPHYQQYVEIMVHSLKGGSRPVLARVDPSISMCAPSLSHGSNCSERARSAHVPANADKENIIEASQFDDCDHCECLVVDASELARFDSQTSINDEVRKPFSLILLQSDDDLASSIVTCEVFLCAELCKVGETTISEMLSVGVCMRDVYRIPTPSLACCSGPQSSL